MRNILIVHLSLILLASNFSFAQTTVPFTGVDPQFSQNMIASGFFSGGDSAATQKLILSQGLKVVNAPRISPSHDDNYSLALEEGQIQNQKVAGICWIESMTSKVEIEAIHQNKLLQRTSLSRSYTFFYYLLERAGMYVDSLIAMRATHTSMTGKDLVGAVSNPGIQDGQDPMDFEVIVNKWGMVPMEVMPTPASLKNDGEFMTEYNRYLTGMGYWLLNYSLTFTDARPLSTLSTNINQNFQLAPLTTSQQAALQSMKATILTGVWKMLAANLGTPPASFAFKVPGARGTNSVQNFDPKSFANYLGVDIKNWVLVGNMYNFERGKAYHVVNYPSLAGGFTALNLDAERMAQLTEQSIRAYHAVPFMMKFDDVVNGINEKNGDIIVGSVGNLGAFSISGDQAPPNLNTVELQRLGILDVDHALVMTAIDRPDGSALPQPWIKARVENSWGVKSGYEGNYALYYDSFIRDVGAIFVDYSLLSPDEQKALQDPNMPSADNNDMGSIGHAATRGASVSQKP